MKMFAYELILTFRFNITIIRITKFLISEMIVKRKGIIIECGGIIRKIYKREEKKKYTTISPPPHKIRSS